MLCNSVVPDVTPIWAGKQDGLNGNGRKCKHIQPQADMTRQIIAQFVRISYSCKTYVVNSINSWITVTHIAAAMTAMTAD